MYEMNSYLTLEYKYSLSDLEEMLPWERDYYILLVEKYVATKKKALNDAANN